MTTPSEPPAGVKVTRVDVRIGPARAKVDLQAAEWGMVMAAVARLGFGFLYQAIAEQLVAQGALEKDPTGYRPSEPPPAPTTDVS